jgi:NADP-dependent 3-hydroxy acid dehydrogenase YdfG
MELNGKAVLVTGGGSGIGLGIATALAEEGCRVAICGRDAKKLAVAADQFAGPSPIIFRSCDVSDRASVRQLVAWAVEQLGPIDILATSAGINVANRSMEKLVPADWDRIMAINATGTYNCIHAVLPSMRARQTGLIVNISSIAGKRALMLAGPAYAASKFAATALGTAVGQEIKADGVRMTNIYPGEVNTPILDQRPVPVPDDRKAIMVQPENIGAMVVAIAKLPGHVQVPELIITPLYQDYV